MPTDEGAMTFIGKLFVMVNLALSLLLAAGAFALYAGGIDWSDNPAKAGQPAGRVAARKSELTDLIKSIAPVYEGWRSIRSEVLQRDQERREGRLWYAGELAHLRNKASAANPARTVVLDRHLPVPDPRNRNFPRMDPAVDRAGQPLLSLEEYLRRLEVVRRDNLHVLGELNKQISEDTRLTNLIAGSGTNKGLRTQLVEEQEKREGIQSEIDLTRPLFINTLVESELVKKRYEAMQERIKELKEYLRSKHKVDVASAAR